MKLEKKLEKCDNEESKIATFIYFDYKHFQKELGYICLDLHCKSLSQAKKKVINYLIRIQQELNDSSLKPNCE